MIWRPTLWHAGIALLIAVLTMAVPMLPALGQGLSVQEQLDRLERDLSMLQRQVYSRSGGIPDIQPGSKGAVDIEIRMERLERQMRDLTGRVETVANEVERMHQRLGQSGGAVTAGNAAVGAQPPGASEADEPASAGQPGPSAQAGGLPPPISLTPPPASSAPDRDGPVTPPRNARAASVPVPGQLPSGSALDQYNFAFGLLKAANYPAAERALRAFVREHPDSSLADNAQYWLGETYYMRGRYADAAGVFAAGYRRFPHGNKAPDNLLKLGMSLARAGQRQNACIAFGQLDHAFPHARTAIKSAAAAEQKRLGC